MSENTASVDEIVERIGFGRFQRKLLVICGLGWAADAMEVILIAFVLPSVIRDWSLGSDEAGLIGTAIFLGMLAGAWFWGAVSDRFGRKPGFQLTVLIDSIFGFLSALSPSYLWLVLFRALTGFGVGGTLPVDYSIFSEYVPRRRRGRYLVLLESFWALGTIAAAALAWLIVPSWGWRPLLAASAIPGLLVFFIRRDVPESPRYLLLAGREEEARAVLERVARENGVSIAIGRLRSSERATRAPVAALWRKPLIRVTAMFWIAWFAISLGYYGTFLWLPSILVERGFDFLQTYRYTFLLALAQLPGYFSAAYLVERWGRKPTLTAYLLASGVFTFLFAAARGPTAIVAAAVLMSFFTLGAWGVLYAYTPESYPTEIRSTGMGAASGMTRVAGAIAPMLGAFLLPISLIAALTVYALSFGVGALAVLLLGRETRGTPLAETLTVSLPEREPR